MTTMKLILIAVVVMACAAFALLGTAFVVMNIARHMDFTPDQLATIGGCALVLGGIFSIAAMMLSDTNIQ